MVFAGYSDCAQIPIEFNKLTKLVLPHPRRCTSYLHGFFNRHSWPETLEEPKVYKTCPWTVFFGVYDDTISMVPELKQAGLRSIQ